ncbi:cytochrome aa3 quinol oxidase subunit IV [Bacillus sp. HNG]|uniref:cytochrome aa3 quinol oxidase subunit IV n=1 Tax=Bacillus sp. HNG TaxID=2293325 RepID=UPI000E2E7A26|nr:cytochrome aa3 quinol oxidase subunit IV [Bacillus sp. HNG]RFB13633.1 cytochrome aa3 quinol oxidase subunit IV [Bacillus sp. HNG]
MNELFPRKQIMGFVFSLVLTSVALVVYFLDLTFAVGIAILIVTAFIQAALQLVVFMHAGETEDKAAIYTNVYFMLGIALITIFGTLLIFLWDM